MALTIKIPAKAGVSNKPHIPPKNDLISPTSKTAHSHYEHELKPFIDWISIVITPPDKDQHHIHNAFWSAVDDPELFADALSAEKKAAGSGFNKAKRLVLPSVMAPKKRPTLFIRYLKEQNRISKLRLDFVPVDLGPNGMIELHVAIHTILPDGWAYVVEHGRITRIDVAIDLPDLTMDSIQLKPKKTAHTQKWFPDGQLETIYIGKPGSNQTAIYDRSKKREKLGQDMPPCLRIERRIKPAGMKLTNLPAMKNPFTGTALLIALPGPFNPQKVNDWSMFSDSVKERGLSAALALLPKDRRAAYKTYIEAHALPAWDPLEIWERWKPMLEELKIAEPSW